MHFQAFTDTLFDLATDLKYVQPLREVEAVINQQR